VDNYGLQSLKSGAVRRSLNLVERAETFRN